MPVTCDIDLTTGNTHIARITIPIPADATLRPEAFQQRLAHALEAFNQAFQEDPTPG